MTLSCDRCRTSLPDAFLNTPAPVACPGCHAPLLARVFPAFARGGIVPGHAAETVGSDEDAGCFFHPRKKALVSCARCGRFLCALCDLEIGGQHLCPTCVTAATPGAAGPQALANEHVLYDQVALSLTTLPLLVWPFTLLAAPVALFFVVRYWNEPPRRLIPARRTKLVAAALLAALELAGWGVFVYYALAPHARISF